MSNSTTHQSESAALDQALNGIRPLIATRVVMHTLPSIMTDRRLAHVFILMSLAPVPRAFVASTAETTS